MRGLQPTIVLALLTVMAMPLAAQIRFEAEDVSEPGDAWVENRDSANRWNLWSTDADAERKWSGGVVLRSPLVMADRQRPEDGAPPLKTVIHDVSPGVYTVELKVSRTLGVSLDGVTWQRYTGGPLLTGHRVAEGDSISFWVDDRFAVENEAGRGAAYYDCVLLTPHRSFEQGIANPGFEEQAADGGIADWTWWSRDGNGQAALVTGTARSGERAVQIDYDGETDWAWTNAVRLPVQPEDELCVRAWVQGSAGGQPVSIDVIGYRDGKLVSWQIGRTGASPRGGWTEAKGFLRVPDSVNEVQVRLTGRGKTDVIVDDVSLRKEKIEFPDRPPVRGWAETRVREKLGRGAVAMWRDDGVYLSWRLLDEDAAGITFDVLRQIGDGAEEKLNPQPIEQTTGYLDTSAPRQGPQPTYTVRPAGKQFGPACEAVWAEADGSTPYVRIPLRDKTMVFQKVGIADLNGDGVYDYVIKQPHQNIDPWHVYWQKSPDTYKIEAYLSDGTFLWANDLGWAIERGIWYSPYIVGDLTGDGRAEVAAKIGEGDPRDEDGKVTSGPEYIVVWDGMTGREIARAPWPDRDLFDSYNYASRNQIAIAYLDGKTPCLLTLRGTYNRMVAHAYQLRDGRLEPLWKYDNEPYGGLYWGQGAHFTQCADIDGDGRDEVLLGSVVLDDNGTPLWSTGRGHPDAFYLTDILPATPGMEIAYVMETRQTAGGGLNVIDARTGRTVWKLDEPTRHVHGKGMCADIDPTQTGCEVYGADADGHALTENRWFFAADGTLLRRGTDCPWSFDISTVYWDADLQKEILRGSRIAAYQGGTLAEGISGRVVLKADVLGDWREEIIASVDGELRIYTTPIPAMDRRVCLMQDPVYRQATTMNAMGYTQDPTLSYNPEMRSPNLNMTCLTEGRTEPVLQVVVSAPSDRPIQGQVRLATRAELSLEPAELAVQLEPGARFVQLVKMVARENTAVQGVVHARLDGPGVSLRGQTSVEIPGRRD
ncbi:MAG: hypothetical protein KJ000_17385 [Pirellulaceae bacterium]|nr:hypothetical protein [Pirellulaceae bacterium]